MWTHLQIHILMVKPQWIHVNTIFDQKHRPASFSNFYRKTAAPKHQNHQGRTAAPRCSPSWPVTCRPCCASRGTGCTAAQSPGTWRCGAWRWRRRAPCTARGWEVTLAAMAGWGDGEGFRMGLLYFYFSYYKNEIQYSRMIIMMIMYIWEWYSNNNNNITIIITIIIIITIVITTIITTIIIWYKSSGYAGFIPFRFVVPVQFRSAAFKSVDNMATWRCNLFICISGGDQKRVICTLRRHVWNNFPKLQLEQ